MTKQQATGDQVMVVTPSDCLWRRLCEPLRQAGYGPVRVAGPSELARHRRQRPFLVCFVDARGDRPERVVAGCMRGRPGERYVLVVGPWQALESDALERVGPAYGFLREPFGATEVRAWGRRAAGEARLLRGDRPLEDVLYARFRAFLQNLGPQAWNSVYDLVWQQVDRPLITAVLEHTGGNQSKAAEILGVHRNTLRTRIRSLGIAAASPDEQA